MLANYARYIKDHHLRALTVSLLKAYRDMDVPLLDKFASLSQEQILALNEGSIAKLLTALEQDKGAEYIEERMKAWESDLLESPLISLTDIDLGDIILISTAQKQALSQFVDGYTTDPAQREAIVQALKEHFTNSRKAGTEAFFRIRMRLR